MNMIRRKLSNVYAPHAQPGFLGKGHIARPVIEGDFSQSDPFILLMDDMLDKKDHSPVGGPHPHGGFETVTLVLEGELSDGPGGLSAGDFEMMTAGSGVVHTEIISKPTKMRILQLWLNLPKENRKAGPRLQRLKNNQVPAEVTEAYSLKVYSGTFASLTSPIKNYTPVTIAEVKLKPNAILTTTLPSDYTAFAYTVGGTLLAGDDNKQVDADHVGWFDRFGFNERTEITFQAGDKGAHFVFYAAEPQRHPIVSHGPFIADTMDDIRQLYSDYRAGKMKHIDEVAHGQLIL